MKKNRWILVASTALLSASLTACGSRENAKDQTENVTETTQTEIRDETKEAEARERLKNQEDSRIAKDNAEVSEIEQVIVLAESAQDEVDRVVEIAEESSQVNTTSQDEVTYIVAEASEELMSKGNVSNENLNESLEKAELTLEKISDNQDSINNEAVHMPIEYSNANYVEPIQSEEVDDYQIQPLFVASNVNPLDPIENSTSTKEVYPSEEETEANELPTPASKPQKHQSIENEFEESIKNEANLQTEYFISEEDQLNVVQPDEPINEKVTKDPDTTALEDVEAESPNLTAQSEVVQDNETEPILVNQENTNDKEIENVEDKPLLAIQDSEIDIDITIEANSPAAEEVIDSISTTISEKEPREESINGATSEQITIDADEISVDPATSENETTEVTGELVEEENDTEKSHEELNHDSEGQGNNEKQHGEIASSTTAQKI